ncbi:MAG: hypothetical protein SFX72_00400 [Isosphaeraceae bacterium]|nr:hypothetical protein [Isosphaeraceae bacterium]
MSPRQSRQAELVPKLLKNAKSWSSIELTVENTTHQYGTLAKGGVPRFEMRLEYIETDRGQRKLRETQTLGETEGPVTEVFSDGERSALVRYHPVDGKLVQESINVTRSFYSEVLTGYTDRPVPLRYDYVGLVPLHEAIVGARFLGDSEVIGRTCGVFLFPKNRPNDTLDLVYHIDWDHGLPLRVEYHRTGRAEEGRPNAAWEAKAIEKYDGRPLVSSSKYAAFDTRNGDGRSVTLEIDHSIVSARFDLAYPSTMFWYQAGPGVHVVDAPGGKTYDTPGVAPVAAKTGAPIVVEPPDPGRLPRIATWVSLALAAVIVITLAARRIRGGIRS